MVYYFTFLYLLYLIVIILKLEKYKLRNKIFIKPLQGKLVRFTFRPTFLAQGQRKVHFMFMLMVHGILPLFKYIFKRTLLPTSRIKDEYC